MSKWIEQLKNHPAVDSWVKLQTSLHSKDLEKRVDEQSVEDIARIQKVISYLNNIFNNFDPELTTSITLTNINKNATACLSEINSFIGNGNIGHLTNANNYVDSLLAVFESTHASNFSITKKSIRESISAYSDALNASLDNYTQKTQKNITEFSDSFKELNKRLHEQEALLASIKSDAETVKQTIQIQTSEFNTQFQSSEKERKEKNERILERLNDDVDETIKILESKMDENFKDLSIKSSKIIEVLVKLQDDAEKVYGVTLNTLQGGAYSSYANEERKLANKYRRYASLLMITGVAFLVVPELFSLFKLEDYTFEWLKVLGRVPLALVVFVPAFYFARESGKHRNTEVINRRRQHILTTLDPYLALMNPDSAQELKNHVAKTVFSESVSSTNESDKDTGNIISLLTNFAKQIKH